MLAIRYIGYDCQTNETRYAAPAGWGTGIPEQNARLIANAPDFAQALRNIIYGVPGHGAAVDRERALALLARIDCNG